MAALHDTANDEVIARALWAEENYQSQYDVLGGENGADSDSDYDAKQPRSKKQKRGRSTAKSGGTRGARIVLARMQDAPTQAPCAGQPAPTPTLNIWACTPCSPGQQAQHGVRRRSAARAQRASGRQYACVRARCCRR